MLMDNIVPKHIEKQCLDALARLRAGNVTSPALLRRQRKGRLKITARAVAEEAGVNHSNLSRRYRHLRKIIDSAFATNAAEEASSASMQLVVLRNELREVRSDRDMLATHNVALLQRNRDLERLLRLKQSTK